ncbi:MarR family winged helix-turn-helix transcriptional regulator [Micromonospora sp. 067-2]|uniref:MarR family winged helix-turn-helix transcriptional regulator n=1 Tax=Micromonospora sp. 067-2 TaxID=2789270 RepID=UPI00397CD1A2
MTGRHPYTRENLEGKLGRGLFPEIRYSMLEFVGQYLLDFERAAQASGLTLAQARVLGFAAVKPSSMREMAEQFGCDPSNLTAKVDRLVELGYVERRADDRDRRIKLVAATPAGVKASSDLCYSREWLATVIDGLTDGEIETVRSALAVLLRQPLRPGLDSSSAGGTSDQFE